MEESIVQSFFVLEDFAHRKLFEGLIYPWEALAQLETYLGKQSLGKIESEIPDSVHLVNPSMISIGKETIIEPGAFIQGPCIIGSNCLIRNGAYIRGGLICGDNCIIGHTTEIKHVIMLNGSKAAHFNYVGDSILGNEVNLGAGVKCANLRLDSAQVVIRFKNQKIPSGLKKMGAIIGDGGQIGCNSVLNPGTIIGKEAVVYPCINVSGYVAPQSLIKVTSHDNN